MCCSQPPSRAGRFLFSAVIFSVLSAFCRGEEAPLYKNTHAPLEQRVDSLFEALTPQERLTLLSGEGFGTRPIPRLGVPAMGMVDAGQGVRGGPKGTRGPATLFTSGVLLGASWDTDLAGRIGRGVGEEAANKGPGAQVVLGPGVNIIRVPVDGRNGEYLGEDPVLAARMAVAYIKGVQGAGVAACVKHYDANSQEFNRGSIDERIGERALRELYTPAFIAAVREGGVWAVMSAYNQVNGEFCSANDWLQNEILKRENGFDGVLMTDWGGLHDTLAIKAGCDLEMPGGGAMMPGRVSQALKEGTLGQARVDDAVRRVLRMIIRVGLMDGPRAPDPSKVNSPEHQKLALRAAEEGIVLLKNQGGVLPLDANSLRSIALVGPCVKDWQMGEGGSANVQPVQSVNAYDGIVTRAGKDITVTYANTYDANYTGEVIPSSVLKPARGDGKGLTRDYYDTANPSAKPVLTKVDAEADVDPTAEAADPKAARRKKFRAEWTGTLTAPATGPYRLNVDVNTRGAGARLYLDGQLIQDKWPAFDGGKIAGEVSLLAGRAYRLRIEYIHYDGDARMRLTWLTPGQDLFKAEVDAARKAQVAVVFVGSGGESEGSDRPGMALPGVQNDLIRAVAAANPRTIVVLNNGGPVLVSGWIKDVPGVMEAFFPAEYGGTALARILFGDVNPSGKLTYTVGKTREAYPDFGNYPLRPGTFDWKKGFSDGEVDYKEGIYVGYRYFDKHNLEPSFPFGFGLSYTTFRYGGMRVSSARLSPDGKVTVTADITNTGGRAGAEVVQLYMQPLAPKVDRPVRELKGFARVELAPGETKSASFTVTARDLAYYDVPGKQWKADAGAYGLELGASSRDLRLHSDITLEKDYTDRIADMGAVSPGGVVKPAIVGEPIGPTP